MRPVFTITFLFLSMLWVMTVSATGTPGQSEFARGDFEAAKVQLITAQKENPKDASILILLGRTHMQLNDSDAAAKQFDAAVAVAPENPDTHYWYGRIYGQLAGNASMFKAGGYAKKARKGFERAVSLDPNHVGAHKGMIEYFLNAPRLFGGSVEDALETAERLQTIDPFEGRLALANIYQRDDREDEARIEFEALTKEFPSDPRGFLNLGAIERDGENYDRAHRLFSKAAAMRSDNEEGQDAVKGALYQVGRTAVVSEQNVADGIAAYKKYLSLSVGDDLPAKEWAHFRLGNLYELSDQADLAHKHYAMARKTDDKDLKRRLARK